MNDRETSIKTTLFLVIGVLLLLSLVVCIIIVGQESNFDEVESYVTEVVKDSNGTGKNSVSLVYDVDGTTYEYEYVTKKDLNENDRVILFYNPNNPSYVTVEKTSKIIFLFPVIGLVLCIAGLYELFRRSRTSVDQEEQFKTSVIGVVGNTQQLKIVTDEVEVQEYEKSHEEKLESGVKPIKKNDDVVVKEKVELPAPAQPVVEVPVPMPKEVEAPKPVPVEVKEEVKTEPKPASVPVAAVPATSPSTSAPVKTETVPEVAPKASTSSQMTEAIVKKVQSNMANADGKTELAEEDIKKVIKDVLKEVIQEVKEEKEPPKKVVQRRVLPNYYYISGTSLIYEEPGKEAKEISLKTVKSVVRTVNSEGNVVKLIVSNEEIKCILTNMKNIDLEQVASLLNNKMRTIDENFKEEVEYKEY